MESNPDAKHSEETWISVRGTATYVLHIGSDLVNETAIVIIPGNPGVAQYYADFMSGLHKLCQLPIYCVSHVGHVTPPTEQVSIEGGQPKFQGWNLNHQIEHKLAFITDHLMSRRRLILIGHSIGCYIILKMLSANVENSLANNQTDHRVLKCCLLFPAIERISQTPTGRKATPFLRKFHWIIPLISYPLCYLLPHTIKRLLIERYFSDSRVTRCAVEATMKLTSPGAIACSAYMAKAEMDAVQELDLETISSHMEKLFFYYGANDHWCPVEYCHNMRATFPDASIELCRRNMEHAFVLRSSEEMAGVVCDWLRSNSVIY